jgi:hypothetical protein
MYAVRLARLRDGALASLTWSHEFAGPLWTAQCLLRGCPVETVPAPRCQCGLYAVARGRLGSGRAGEVRLVWGPAVLGVHIAPVAVLVEARGRVLRHESGTIRSAVQAPLHIWAPGLSGAHAAQMAERYQCSVDASLDGAAWWADVTRWAPGLTTL